MLYLVEKPVDLSGNFTVLDDSNNITESYTLKQIKDCVNAGNEIKGVTKEERLIKLTVVKPTKTCKEK